MDYKYSSSSHVLSDSDSEVQIVHRTRRHSKQHQNTTLKGRPTYCNGDQKIFLFPPVDLDVFDIKDPKDLYDFLLQLWNESKLLQRFPCTLMYQAKRGEPIITCTSSRCKYFIRLKKISHRHNYKISAINYWHNHDKIRIRTRYLSNKTETRATQTRRQVEKLLEIYGSHYVKELLKKSILRHRQNPFYSKVKLKLSNFTPHQFIQQQQQYQMIKDLENKAIQVLESPFSDENTKSYDSLKREIIRDALIEHRRQECIIKGAQDQQINVLTEIILYSSAQMQENFKKWGKSVYIGQLSGNFYGKDADISQDEDARFNCIGKYVFCGTDHELNIVVFAIGVINAPNSWMIKKYEALSCMPRKMKKDLMQMFMTKIPSFNECRSILIKERHEELLDVLEELRDDEPFQRKYIIKYKIQSWEHISDYQKNPYTCTKPGIVAEMVSMQYYKDYLLSDCNKNANIPKQNDAQPENPHGMSRRKRAKMSKAERIKKYPALTVRFYNQRTLRLVDILLRKACLALNGENFAKAHNQLLGWFKHDESYEHFTKIFYPKLRYYALRDFGGKNQNAGFLGFTLLVNFEFWINKIKKQFFKIEYPKYKKIRRNPLFTNDHKNLTFKEEPVRKLKNDINYGYERWYQEEIVQEVEESSYNVVQETLKNLILIFCQHKSKFAIDENYLENVGFNSSVEESESSNYIEQKQKTKFKTNKIIYNKEHRSYFQYFLQHLNVEGDTYRDNTRKFQKLPYYNLTKLYLSRQTQHLLLGYELLNILGYNFYQISQKESSWGEKVYGINSYQDESLLKIKEKQTEDIDDEKQDEVEEVRVFYVGNYKSDNRVRLIKKKAAVKEDGNKRKEKHDLFWQCDCLFTVYMGIPCRHILKAIMATDSNILSGFDSFWLKSQQEEKKYFNKKPKGVMPGNRYFDNHEEQMTLETLNTSQNLLSYVYHFNPVTNTYEYKYLYDNQNPLTTTKREQFDDWLARIVDRGYRIDHEGLHKQRIYNFFAKKDNL